MNVIERFEGYRYKYKREQERESVRQFVREMETVPNEIKYVPVETQKQKTEQRAVENLFACRYLSVYKICNAEYRRQKAAINIRKTVSVSYMNSRQKISETFNESLVC